MKNIVFLKDCPDLSNKVETEGKDKDGDTNKVVYFQNKKVSHAIYHVAAITVSDAATQCLETSPKT